MQCKSSRQTRQVPPLYPPLLVTKRPASKWPLTLTATSTSRDRLGTIPAFLSQVLRLTSLLTVTHAVASFSGSPDCLTRDAVLSRPIDGCSAVTQPYSNQVVFVYRGTCAFYAKSNQIKATSILSNPV